MNFNKEQAKIISDVKSLCECESEMDKLHKYTMRNKLGHNSIYAARLWRDAAKRECEGVLHELFEYDNHDVYFEKLGDLYYALKPYTEKDNDFYIKSMGIEEVVLTLLNAFIGYEYFNKHIKDKGHYDSTKIEKQFEKIEPFLADKSKARLYPPTHPNETYNHTLNLLIEEYGADSATAQMLLNIIFDTEKKLPQTKQGKRWLEHSKDFTYDKTLEDYEREYKEEAIQMREDLEKIIEKETDKDKIKLLKQLKKIL